MSWYVGCTACVQGATQQSSYHAHCLLAVVSLLVHACMVLPKQQQVDNKCHVVMVAIELTCCL